MNEKRFETNQVFYVALFTILATLCNYFKYPLYEGIDIIFGSIFVMLVVIRYGTLPALIVSCIASLVTYYHWNHPYAIFYFFIETLYVSLRYKKKQGNITIHDAVFWAIPGLLIIPTYYFLLGRDIYIALSVYLKCAVNGTANALIASFLFHSYQYLLFRMNKPFRRISFKNLTLELLVLMVIVPLIVTIFFVIKKDVNYRKESVKKSLLEISESLSTSINIYVMDSMKKLSEFSKIFSVYDKRNIVQKAIENFIVINGTFEHVVLLDNRFNIIAQASKEKSQTSVKNIKLFDHDYFNKIKQKSNSSFPLELYFDPVTNDYFVVFLVESRDSAIQNYLVAFVNSNFINSQLKDKLHNKDFLITLLDGRGKVITSTNNKYETGSSWIEKIPYKYISSNIMQANLEDNNNGSYAVIWSKSYYSAEKIINKEYGWRIIVEFPLKQFSNTIIKEINYVLLCIFVVILFSIVFANYLHRITVDPINDIVFETTNIKDKLNSDLNLKKRAFFIKEFNQLMENYYEAYNQILIYLKEIRDRNIRLEDEVDNRTRQIKVTEDSYKNLSENLLDIIFRYKLRPKLKFKYINRSVERILGYSIHQFYEQPDFILKIVHPDDKATIKKYILKKQQSQSPLVLRFISNYGTTKWLELNETFQYGKKGEIISIEGIARDITERRILSDMLSDSIYQFKTVFDLAPDAIFMADIETGLIIDANQSATRLLNLKRHEIIGRHFLTLHPYEQVEYAKERFTSHAKGEIGYVHIDALRSDGVKVPVEVIASKFTLKGRDIICGFFRNITERKKHEEEMKTAITEKELLVKEVHHRVKNNMQVMLSLIDLQSLMTKDDSIKTILFDLRQRIKAMAMVHETLYRSDLTISHINLQKYIYDIVEDLNTFYRKTNIVINKSIDISTLQFDKALKIGMIINEIITNAFKHAFPNNANGKIDLTITNLTEKMIKLQISDNGVGLSPTFDINKDVSLGLELVKILVSQMDATMDIRNDNGLTIVITIPL